MDKNTCSKCLVLVGALLILCLSPPSWGQKTSSEDSIIVKNNLFSRYRRYLPPPQKGKAKGFLPWVERVKKAIHLQGIYQIQGTPRALLKIRPDLTEKWGITTDSRGFITVKPGDPLGEFTVAQIGKDSLTLEGDGGRVTLKLADSVSGEALSPSKSPVPGHGKGPSPSARRPPR